MSDKKKAVQVYLNEDMHQDVLEYQIVSKRPSMSNTIEFLIHLALKRVDELRLNHR